MIDGSVDRLQEVQTSHNSITIDRTLGVARTLTAISTDSVEIALTELKSSAIDPALGVLNVERVEPDGENSDRPGLMFWGMESLDSGIFTAAQFKPDEPRLGKPEINGKDFKALCRDTNLKPVDSAPIAGGRHQTVLAAAYRWEWLDRDIADDANAAKDFLAWSQRHKHELQHIRQTDSEIGDRLQAIWNTRKPIKYETLGAAGATDWVCIPRIDLATWERVAARYDVTLPKRIPTDTAARSVAFWAWIRAKKIPITTTEGIKKALSLLTLGIPAISVPGVWMATHRTNPNGIRELQRHELSPTIAAFSSCSLTIAFDSDEKQKTRRTVGKAIDRLAFAAMAAGFKKITIAEWDTTLGKGIDDVAANGHDAASIIAAATPYALHRAKAYMDLGDRYPISRYIPCSEFVGGKYLPAIPLPAAQIIGIRAAMGTGKSETIAAWLQEWRSVNHDGVAILPTYRNSLGRSLADRFGIDLHIDDVARYGAAGLQDFWACVDSLVSPKFNPDDWRGRPLFIVWDELNQQVWSWLTSETHAHRRTEILTNLSLLLTIARQHPQSVIVAADEMLSDSSLMMIEAMIGHELQPYIIDSERPKKPRNAVVYDDATDWVNELLKAVRRGDKCLIHTSGQRCDSKYGSINLQRLIDEHCPGHGGILRLDSETTGTANSDASIAMKDLNAALQRYQVTIATSVIESGSSIDRNIPIDSVWAISHGNGSPEFSFRQMIERYRGDCDRHIYVPDSAIGKRIGNGSVSAKKLREDQDAKAKAIVKACSAFDELREFAGFYDAIDTVGIWSRYAAYINASKDGFKAAVISGLKRDGYRITRAAGTIEDQDIMNEMLQDAKSASCSQDSDDVAAAANITESEYLKNKRAAVLPRPDRLAARKFVVAESAAIEPAAVTPDTVTRHRDGWYNRARWHYDLLNIDWLQERDRYSIGHSHHASGGITPLDAVKRWKSTKARTLQLIGFTTLLQRITNDPDAIIDRNDSDIIAIGEKLSKFPAAQIHSVLGVAYKRDDDPGKIGMSITRSLLQSVGIMLQRNGHRNPDRSWQYKIESELGGSIAADGRAEFFDRLNDRRVELQAKFDRDQSDWLQQKMTDATPQKTTDNLYKDRWGEFQTTDPVSVSEPPKKNQSNLRNVGVSAAAALIEQPDTRPIAYPTRPPIAIPDPKPTTPIELLRWYSGTAIG
jgi:hypothetical protein